MRHLAGLWPPSDIARIAGPRDQTSALDRLDGYAGVSCSSGGPRAGRGRRLHGGGRRAGDGRAAGEAADVDGAVFAANDLMASGALRVLREGGAARCRRTSALVGFDDMESASPEAARTRR
nr:hypothetical protein OG461_03210 [Streptomyces sp. NBC_00995]